MCSVVSTVDRRERNVNVNVNNNATMHVTTARSSADLAKRTQTPTRHILAEDTLILVCTVCARKHTAVQWSGDVITADPVFGRSRVRLRVAPQFQT